jgi:hypothetical protein
MTDTHHPPIGLEALRAALKTVPGTPGIYKMIDGAGKILYIGTGAQQEYLLQQRHGGIERQHIREGPEIFPGFVLCPPVTS